MKIQINGVEVDAADDNHLIPACEGYASSIVGHANRAERNQMLERLLVQMAFLSVKMGAIAAVMLTPEGRIDRQVFAELAVLMGQTVGFNFQFRLPETQVERAVSDALQATAATEPTPAIIVP